MKYIKFSRAIFNMNEFKKVTLNKSELRFVFSDGSEYIFHFGEILSKRLFDSFADFLSGFHLFPMYKDCNDVFDFEYVKTCVEDD
jgi:hypothetical protein